MNLNDWENFNDEEKMNFCNCIGSSIAEDSLAITQWENIFYFLMDYIKRSPGKISIEEAREELDRMEDAMIEIENEEEKEIENEELDLFDKGLKESADDMVSICELYFEDLRKRLKQDKKISDEDLCEAMEGIRYAANQISDF